MSLIHQRIARQIAACPDAVAVVAATGTLTYAELGIRASRLAHRLRRIGVGPEDVVAGIVDRGGADWPAVALAVWSAGATYLPIDPRTPPARTRAMLAPARALVGMAATVLPYEDLCPAAVLLDVDRSAIAAEPAHPPAVAVLPDHLACLAHTVGPDGTPRPVAIPHRAILAAVDSGGHASTSGLRGRGCLHVGAQSLDGHVVQLVRALTSGARLILSDVSHAVDPRAAHDLIDRTGASSAVFTSSALSSLTEHAERAGRTIALRQIVVEGEDWPAEQWRRLSRVAPDAWLRRVYGASETALTALFHDAAPFHDVARDVDVEGLAGRPVPLGCPPPGVRALVLGPDLRPVPAGHSGELYLAGPVLARGYHGRPADTAERFVPCPEGPPGERMYRTGVIVRQGPDGVLVLQGRADDEIRIGGVRGSLSAVEATLARHGEVVTAAAVMAESTGGQVLTAHVVPVGEADGLEQRLRDHAAQFLPPALVPVGVRIWDRLPVGADGTLDREELARQPVTDLPDTTAALIGSIWGELLGRPPRTADEDLFAAGGDWSTAALLGAAVRASLDTDLPDAAVFAAPSVAGIARAVADHVARPAATTTATPLSPLQRRIWLLHRLDPGDPAYHIPTLLRLTGPLDRDRLDRAFAWLIERHDALRMRFVSGPDGTPRQYAAPSGPLDIELVDATGGSAADLIEERIRAPFDLAVGPPVRAALLRHARERHELLIVVHHIVFDGWSERVLVRELGQAYSALAAGSTPDLPAPPIGFAAVAAWQARRSADGTVDADCAYWSEQLSDPPPPLDLPGPGGQGRGRAGEQVRRFSGPLTARVRAAARGHRTTGHTVLLAAFAVLLGRWSGRPDLVVGVPHAARDRDEVDDLIGFLVTTLPLRLRVPGETTFSAAVRAVGRALASGVAHCEAPFDRIVADLGLGGTSRRSPLFRVWFNMLGPPTAAPEMTDLTTAFVQPTATSALFDLNVYLTEEPDGYRLRLVHDLDVIDAGHAAELADQYLLLLDAVCAQPEVPVDVHDVRTPASLATLPDETLNVAADPPPLASTLWSVKDRHPDRTAVTGTGGDLSYAAVYDRAGELAGRLMSAGVGPGDVVPVLAARTPALVPALLGVMATGAAFTVLDAGYPTDRLAEQVRQVGATTGVRDPATGRLPVPLVQICPQWIDVGMGSADRPHAVPLDPAGPAMYVAFTSGTSGVPQGVVGGSVPVAHFLGWYADRFGIGPEDRFAVLSGLAHDPLLRDVLAPLWVGGTACVPPAELLLSPAALRRWLAEERVTVVHLTPPLARLLAKPQHAPKSHARLVVLGGDSVRRIDVELVRLWAPRAVVVNAYGATETPQIAALAVVSNGAGGERDDGPMPVGTGAPGAQLLVVARTGRPAAVGERGEVVVRGRYLAHGYLHDQGPGRFAADPVRGHRRFATGDVGRYGVDGTVTVLGRADDQVKVNGVRFEPAEIESRLRRHPAVADAIAGVRPGPAGVPIVIAGVVPEPGHEPDEADMRGFLREVLPQSVLPARIVVLEAIPLTGNGKLDRHALPDPPPVRPCRDAEPTSEMERIIAALWSETLGTERVTTTVNFFDLGGSSLLMASLHIALEGRLGHAVAITALFEHPTVRSLARYLTTGAPVTLPDGASRRSAAGVRRRRLAARNAAAGHGGGDPLDDVARRG
ncbi:AMP-binding protein [Nonomuraea sp. NPDC050786]|uniref:AMP-binding protein n=1 Tax=Nonomuraea sp. NPDC050786 TaxID=3154840 RepID=UPI0033D64D64